MACQSFPSRRSPEFPIRRLNAEIAIDDTEIAIDETEADGGVHPIPLRARLNLPGARLKWYVRSESQQQEFGFFRGGHGHPVGATVSTIVGLASRVHGDPQVMNEWILSHHGEGHVDAVLVDHIKVQKSRRVLEQKGVSI